MNSEETLEKNTVKEEITNEKGTARFLPFVYLPLVLIFYELLLRIFAPHPLLENLIFPVLFSGMTGLLAAGLLSLFSPKHIKTAGSVVIFLFGLVYAAECLIHNTLQFYLEPDSIFYSLEGVVTRYSENVSNSVVNSLPIILLFAAPFAVYIAFGRKLRIIPEKRIVRKLSLTAVIVALAVYIITSFAASAGGTREAYKLEYQFNTATEKFGLMASLRLSAQYFVFGNDQGEEFVIEDTAPQIEYSPDNVTLPAEEEEEQDDRDEQENIPADMPDNTEEEDTAPEPEEEETDDEPEQVVQYGYNVMRLDLSGTDSVSDTLKSLNQYVGTLIPTRKNKYTGIFEGKNLILITAEAFTDTVIDEELTPTLYHMTHNGFYFSDYYQPTWGGSTSTGEYSHVMGLVPTDGIDSMFNVRENNNYFTLGNQLQRLGYTSCAYHNGTSTYYNRHLTHENLGYDRFLAFGNGLENEMRSFSDDTILLDTTIKQYVDKQPFSLYYMTISGHSIYDGGNAKVKKYYDLVNARYGNKYKEKTKYYLCYQLELENALTVLIRDLEDAGIADDTVICITADHYPYGLEQSNAFNNTEDYVKDLYGYDYNTPWEKDHNSWIIWSGCLENELSEYSCEISTPTYSLDIVPTLSNLFGLEYDSRLLVGRDVFSDAEPLVVWNSYSWATDKGRYDARTRKFYPAEGCEYDEDYIETISNTVRNKINFSKQAVECDYYGVLFGPDPETGK